mmetsp:Transcript_11275/g.38793  ORF Transcript_11275/g.38793 Transcript_11275/m.38793 type:complete len:285 (-) Transcript_11275:810-1664(-)
MGSVRLFAPPVTPPSISGSGASTVTSGAMRSSSSSTRRTSARRSSFDRARGARSRRSTSATSVASPEYATVCSFGARPVARAFSSGVSPQVQARFAIVAVSSKTWSGQRFAARRPATYAKQIFATRRHSFKPLGVRSTPTSSDLNWSVSSPPPAPRPTARPRRLKSASKDCGPSWPSTCDRNRSGFAKRSRSRDAWTAAASSPSKGTIHLSVSDRCDEMDETTSAPSLVSGVGSTASHDALGRLATRVSGVSRLRTPAKAPAASFVSASSGSRPHTTPAMRSPT